MNEVEKAASESGVSDHPTGSPRRSAVSALATGGQRISYEAGRARADGPVVVSLALSIDPARVTAGVDTLEVVARAVSAAVAVVSALAPRAFPKRVSPGSRGTEAHRSIGPRPVISGSALGSLSTRVRLAQVGLGEGPARLEGVAGEAAGAGADGFVVSDLAVGSLTAHVWIWLTAGVATLEFNASLVLVTVVVSGALSVAAGESVSQKVRGAFAAGTVVAGFA